MKIKLTDDAVNELYLKGRYLGEDAVADLSPSYIHLTEVDEIYSDKALIGRGALKEVFKCYDNRNKRQVAFASLKGELNETYYEMFIREAWLTASLSHPNVIKVYDTGIDEEQRPYFVMDLKSNNTLEEFLNDPHEEHETLEVLLKICDAMSYAHSKGIIHLDLKPQNIQCEEFGEILVCDWGLAKFKGEEAEESEYAYQHALHETLYGEVKGTPGYMAPEQATVGADKDERTDIFALGGILYFLLTSEKPIQGEVKDILERTKAGDYQSPRIAYPEKKISAGIDAVVVKAMQLKPEDRYQSVSEFRKDIERYMFGFGTVAERPNVLKQAYLFLSRHRVTTGIVLTSVLLIVATVLLYTDYTQRLEMARAITEEQAEELSIELLSLNAEFDHYEEEYHTSQRTMAQQIIKVSKGLLDKKLSKELLEDYNTTLTLLDRAEGALKGDDAMQFKKEIRKLRRTIYFTQMNFQAFLTTKYLPNFRNRIAESHLDYAFNLDLRPSIPEVLAVLKSAQQIPRSALEEEYFLRALHYDYLSREKLGKEYNEVVVESIRLLNPAKPPEIVNYYADVDSLFVHISRTTRIKTSHYALELLRLSNARKLKLSGPSFSLNRMNGVGFQVVDFSGVESLYARANELINCPNLKRIYIAEDCAIDEKKLRKVIRSNFDYQVSVKKIEE